jgi:putative protease
MAYSGRCLISNYIGKLPIRDANGGDCIQPCRWEYSAFLTEKKSGEILPVSENSNGTYIFNARDMCMVRYIPELLYSGVRSFKIEGRMKTAYYVAATVKAYRQAIDDHFADPELYESKLDEYTAALARVGASPLDNPLAGGNRFSTGFYFGKPTADDHSYDGANRFSNQDFLGIVEDYNPRTGLGRVEQRNKFTLGDEIEIFRPGENYIQTLRVMLDENGGNIPSAPHPKQKIYIKFDIPVKPFDIIRRVI